MCQLSINFLQDLFTQATGAIIGVSGAVFIFRNQIKKERKDKDKAEKNFQDDKLKYLYLMVRKILSISKHHFETFKEYGKKVADEPIAHYLLRSAPTYELQRFSTQLKIEEYYLSYVSRIKNSSSAENFDELISTCEYACFVLSDALRINEEKNRLKYDKKTQFLNLFHQIELDFNDSYVRQQIWEDHEFNAFIQRCIQSYRERDKETDEVETGFSLFVTPMLNKLYSSTNYKTGYMKPIFEKVHSCYTIYHSMKKDGEKLSLEFKYFSDSMEDVCKKIIEHIAELHNYLEKNSFSVKPLPIWLPDDVEAR